MNDICRKLSSIINEKIESKESNNVEVSIMKKFKKINNYDYTADDDLLPLEIALKYLNIFIEFVINEIDINEELCSYLSKKLTDENKDKNLTVKVVNGLNLKKYIEKCITYHYKIKKEVEEDFEEYLLDNKIYETHSREVDLLIKELKKEIDDTLKENSVYVIVVL